jgi:HD superfamily phosphohydrolase
MTREIVLSPQMRAVWEAMTPPLRALDVVKLALGPGKAKALTFTTWETILSEIIVGDAFGVDRMDYLLRDSYHLGVPYGRFDHFRMIDTLRILPSGSKETAELALGIEEGGLQSAEALLLGRYHMYSQVYFHPIRRIYDIHLRDFLAGWLDGGKFPTDVASHLRRTDNDVMVGILDAAANPEARGHDAGRRIAEHDHFRILYQRHPNDLRVNPDAARVLFGAIQARFGAENVRLDSYKQKRKPMKFPVRSKEGRITPANELSVVLQRLPVVDVNRVYIRPDLWKEADTWLTQNRDRLLQT